VPENPKPLDDLVDDLNDVLEAFRTQTPPPQKLISDLKQWVKAINCKGATFVPGTAGKQEQSS
jgi:hypothetical protein